MRGRCCVWLLTCLCAVISLHAQTRALEFTDMTLAEALAAIDALYPETKVHYVYNQLEQIRVTATARGETAEEAIRSIVGDHPIRITPYRDHLLVEAMAAAEHRMSGHLVDERQEPVADASIMLYDTQTLRLLASGFSDGEGRFSLSAPGGDVRYRISHLRYQTLTCDAEVGALGDIVLHEQLHPLRDVDYGYRLPTYTLDLGMTTLQVAGTPLAQVGTAFDLLAYLPGLPPLGDPMIRYTIDGMPVSSLSELTQLDADQVARIEYSANDLSTAHTTQSRVVNIVTKRAEREWQGQSSTILVQGQATTVRQLITADSHRQRWDLMTHLNYEREGIHKQLRINRADRTEQYATHGIDLMAGMNIRINDRHSVGFRYQYKEILNDIVLHGGELISGFDPDDVEGLEHDLADWRMDFAPSHDLNLYHRGRLGRWQLQTGANYYHDGVQLSDSYLHPSNSIYRHNEVSNTLWAIRLDATRTLWRGRVTVGSEYSFTRREDTYHQSESNLTASRLREQNRLSLLLSYQLPWSELWSSEMGVRAERIDMHRDMRSLYPFASVNYQGMQFQFAASYALHTSMPTYGQTNGYTHYNMEQLNVSSNPDLRPATRHQMNLMAQWGHWSVRGDYQYVTDYIAQHIGYNAGNYFLNYQNVPKASVLDASLIYARTYGRWHMQASGSLYRQWLECRYADGLHSFCHPILQGALRQQWQLPYGMMAHLDMRMQGSGHRGALWQEGQSQVDAGVAKVTGRWTLRLRAEDLFRSSSQRTLSYGNYVRYDRRCYADVQRLLLTVRYAFGSQKQIRKYQGVNAGEAEMQRMQ